MEMKKITLKDFVWNVMIKPIPGVLLKSIAWYEGTILATLGITSVILIISSKIQEKKGLRTRDS